MNATAPSPAVLSTADVAARLVALCQAGQYEQAQRELYASAAVSIEAEVVPAPMRVTRGLEAILAKGRAFREQVQHWHAVEVSGPLVAAQHLALRIRMDVSYHDGTRAVTDEVAVYQVQDGKIVQEQFFY